MTCWKGAGSHRACCAGGPGAVQLLGQDRSSLVSTRAQRTARNTRKRRWCAITCRIWLAGGVVIPSTAARRPSKQHIPNTARRHTRTTVGEQREILWQNEPNGSAKHRRILHVHVYQSSTGRTLCRGNEPYTTGSTDRIQLPVNNNNSKNKDPTVNLDQSRDSHRSLPGQPKGSNASLITDGSTHVNKPYNLITPRHPLADRRDDLYEMTPVATLALLRAERLPKWIWEPACGRGAIVRVLRNAGHEVVATDLVAYGSPDSASQIDFRIEHRSPSGVEAIITNPPYKLAEQFVSRAIDLRPRIVMLLRLAFCESKRRSPVLNDDLLARVHLFSKRLPMMHRGGWNGRRAPSTIAFAWFVWDREHRDPTEPHRITWGNRSDRGLS